jgi:hypothetical protein
MKSLRAFYMIRFTLCAHFIISLFGYDGVLVFVEEVLDCNMEGKDPSLFVFCVAPLVPLFICGKNCPNLIFNFLFI